MHVLIVENNLQILPACLVTRRIVTMDHMTNQLDIGVRRAMVPAASENFCLNVTISGSGKKCDQTDHQPRNLKIRKVSAAIDHMMFKERDCLAIMINCLLLTKKRSQKVWNESIKPPSPHNHPKVQALIDEIINDSSLVKPHDEMTIPPQKNSVLSVVQAKSLPPPPGL